MLKSELQSLFEVKGFVPASHKKDFDYEIPYVLYYSKVLNGEHTYVTAVFSHDTNEFLEACVETYLAVKNTFPPPRGVTATLKSKKPEVVNAALLELKKKGFMSTSCFLVRGENNLKEALK